MPDEPDAGTVEIRFPGDPHSVRAGLARALGAAPVRALSVAGRGTVELVLAEAMNNIAEHAYADDSGPVRLMLWSAGDGSLCCRVEDDGTPMPGGSPPPGNPPPPADLPEGGFGWYLIRHFARDLRYERVDGTNRLSFVLRPEQLAG